MKKSMKRLGVLLLLASMLVGSMTCVGITAQAAEDGFYHGEMTDELLWTQASDLGKYGNHRIPGIVVTKKDTVIVYCEARTGDTSHSLKKNGDWCLMDIYIQRSEDGGKTFGDPIYIAKGDDLRACVNNPVMIVGNDNTLHILYCKNYSLYGGGLWYRKSTDDGLTWSEEVNVTKFASGVEFDCFAFGPTHGICTSNGVLMAPVWLVLEGTGSTGQKTDHSPSVGYVFYSKDNGETWALSERTAQNGGEMCIAELSDGSIILNSRSNPYRKITTSKNGISGWATTYADEQLPDPSCCGGMTAVDLPGLAYAHLFVNCASSEAEDRTKVRLRVSFDDCVTYEKSVLISGYTGGYCDVAVDSKGKVYVIYEIDYGKRVRLATLSYVDTFIGDDALHTSTVSSFSFADESAAALVQKRNHLDQSFADGALRLTANQTKKHSVTFDFTSVTQNLNLSKQSAAVLRLRLNTQTGGEMLMGVYTVSGRVKGSAKEDYGRVTVPSNGEWQDVVVDFSSFGARGMLKTLQLELFTDTLKGAVGDTLDVASIQFFENADAAYASLGMENPNRVTASPSDPQGSPGATEQLGGEGEEKGGCGSSVNGFAAILLPMLAALPVIKGGRRRRSCEPS